MKTKQLKEKVNTFKIKLCCGNCGHNWTATFPKGTHLEMKGMMKETLTTDEGIGGFIDCPNCGCFEEISRAV